MREGEPDGGGREEESFGSKGSRRLGEAAIEEGDDNDSVLEGWTRRWQLHALI